MAALNPAMPLGFFDGETMVRGFHGQEIHVQIPSGLEYTRPDGQRELTWEDAPMHEETKARLRGFIAVLFPEDYVKKNHPRLVVERLIERVAYAGTNPPRLLLSPVLRGPCSLGIDQVLIRGPMKEYIPGNADERMAHALVNFTEALAYVVAFELDEAERSRVAGVILDERKVFHIGMLSREVWDAARSVHAADADAASD